MNSGFVTFKGNFFSGKRSKNSFVQLTGHLSDPLQRPGSIVPDHLIGSSNYLSNFIVAQPLVIAEINDLFLPRTG